MPLLWSNNQNALRLQNSENDPNLQFKSELNKIHLTLFMTFCLFQIIYVAPFSFKLANNNKIWMIKKTNKRYDKDAGKFNMLPTYLDDCQIPPLYLVGKERPLLHRLSLSLDNHPQLFCASYFCLVYFSYYFV